MLVRVGQSAAIALSVIALLAAICVISTVMGIRYWPTRSQEAQAMALEAERLAELRRVEAEAEAQAARARVVAEEAHARVVADNAASTRSCGTNPARSSRRTS